MFTKKRCVLKLTQLTRTLLDRESVEAPKRQAQAQQGADASVENIESIMKSAVDSLFRSGDRGLTTW